MGRRLLVATDSGRRAGHDSGHGVALADADVRAPRERTLAKEPPDVVGHRVEPLAERCEQSLQEVQRERRVMRRERLKALAGQALEVLRNPPLFAKLTGNARSECEKYTWQRIKIDWLEEYAAIAPSGTALSHDLRVVVDGLRERQQIE